jgi:hypothetical protein
VSCAFASQAAGDLEDMFALLDQMDLRGTPPSLPVYSLAFALCFDQETWELLPFLLKRMHAHGVKADTA